MLKPILELKSDITKKYLEYRIKPDDIIDTFSEGMLKNNDIKGLLPIHFQQIDDQRFYHYDISHLISMKDFIRNEICKKDLIHIFVSIINTYLTFNDYLIEENCLLLDFEYIYIDHNSHDVKCLCLPLSNLQNHKSIDDFIKETMMSVKYSNEDNSYITKILNYINSSNISLEELKNYLLSLDTKQNVNQNIKSSQPIKRNAEIPTVINEDHSDIVIKPIYEEKESIPQHVIPKVSIDKPKIKKEEKVISSRGKIPTLRQKNKEQIEENDNIQSTHDKQKKTLFSRAKKENKIPKQASHIPSKKSKESKIPKMSKRITGEEAKKSLTEGIQREVQPAYQENLTKVQASGTTVLGVGTTVLDVGTTVLNDTLKQIYARLLRISTQESVVIDMSNFRIGKDESNSFAIIDNSAISRQHAEIISKEGRFYITDLNSTNKTYVDGIRVIPGSFVEIFDGSCIKLANEDFIFHIVEGN